MRRRQAAKSLLDFTTYTKPDYDPAWYHKLIADKLDEVQAGKIKRLLINIGPQHGKTELVSRRFAAYCLGRNPDLRILNGSHSSGLSELLNGEVKDILRDPLYRNVFPGVELGGKQQAEYFELKDRRGCLKSAGAGVKIAGFTAQMLLLDDPLGSQADADSPAIREKIWNWICSDCMNRLPKTAPIVLVQTRWSIDDPAGRFLRNMANGTGDRWEIINLPSLYRGHKTHPLDPRTEIDEPLWPQHQDTNSLRKMRELNPRSFAALHQQDPTAAGSEWPPEWFGEDVLFDEWPSGEEGSKVIALDTSKGVGGKTGDYSSFIMIHRHKRVFYVEADMDNTRNKLQMRRDALKLIKQFKPRWFVVEESQGGDAFAENLRLDCKADGVSVSIATINNMRPNEQGNLENTPKEQRIRFLTEFLGGQYIRFKRRSSGTQLLIEQMKEFPNGLHDDGPDSLEMGIQIFNGW